MKVQAVYQAPVRSAESADTLADAIDRLAFHEVGALPIFERGRCVGILSERDVIRALADGVEVNTTPVSDYMASGPIGIGPDDELATAGQVMAQFGLRHLPVIERGQVVGMLSIRDLVEQISE